MKLEFSPQNFEKYSNKKLMKFLPLGAEFFHADGRTERQKAKSRFPQFCERA
jgi:hypothetical protein